MRLVHARAVVLLAFMALVTAGCRKPPAVDRAYAAELEKHRSARVASLTSDSGWLTVTGLFWLEPGENTVGSGASNRVLLESPGIPEKAAVLVLGSDGTLRLHVEPGSAVKLNGADPSPGALISNDRSGKPDRIEIGPLRLSIIERGGRLAARVRNPESPARKNFRGISYFPTDPAWKVEASFEPYAASKEVEVPSAQGPPQKMIAPGLLRFRAGGQDLSLEPYLTDPDAASFFIVFSDGTAAKETYGAGRFLDALRPKPESRSVILDFNKAYSPPCAFTPYATCPLPARGNVLPVRVEAGEKAPEGH